MRTREELLALAQELRDTDVLSVYIDGGAVDPALRSAWRTQLDEALDGAREALRDASRAERARFDRAVELLRAELGSVPAGIGAPGWAAFATADGVHHAGPLPVSVTLRVQWGRGAVVAPLVRALTDARPVVIAVVDSRGARIYRYERGALERTDTLRAHVHVEPPAHLGGVPRAGFHTGTRGRTGTDAAARERAEGRARVMAAVVERVVALAGSTGWVLIGGTPMAAREARARLPKAMASRMLVLPALQCRTPEAEIARIAAEGAAALRRRAEADEVRVALERAPVGRGAANVEPTRAALDADAVRQLYLTRRFIDAHPGDAEEMVRAALEQHAEVEVVSGDGAAMLEERGGGVGALLRFRPPPMVPGREAGAAEGAEAGA